MRNVSLLIAICCCLLAASGQSSVVGVVDTIGGTTYDWQMSGPAWRMLAVSPGHGIHAIWMGSADTSGTDPDRGVRYSFHDDSLGSWGMGVNVFAMPTGSGRLDRDTNGVAVVSAHHATGPGQSELASIVARDAAPGAGVFDYSPGEPTLDGYAWPCIGVGSNGYYHLAMIGAGTQDDLYWGRSTTWQTWDSAISIPSPEPEPLFPTHNIAASRASGSSKVCITWVATPAVGYMQVPGFYRESPDGGDSWGAPVELGFPPAYSGDTAPSYHITSLFPFYDRQDRLHIVGNVSPHVRDTNWTNVSEIWHFCPDNAPQWSRIHRAGAHNLLAPMGYNATYACRPSIGADQSGGLHVVWEQFDSANVEPGPPERLRADIFYAQDNGDNGASRRPGVRISEQGTWTCRFPSAVDYFEGDTFKALYLVDQHAGFWQYGEGPATNNPVVCQFIPTYLPGVEEDPRPQTSISTPATTIVRGVLDLGVGSRQETADRAGLLDAAGREVLDLHPGANDVSRLASGVYFVRLSEDGNCLTRKLVLTK